jgi:hypothetical protein
MKNVVILCAAIIGFLALPAIYSTLKGYTIWFWRNPQAQIFVTVSVFLGIYIRQGM